MKMEGAWIQSTNSTQPKSSMQGRWESIHITGAWSDTPQKQAFFCSWIRDQIEHLPCQDCINHAREYLTNDPPEKTDDTFVWTWRFHNTVNRRLGKAEMPYKTAREIYLSGNRPGCGGGCGK